MRDTTKGLAGRAAAVLAQIATWQTVAAIEAGVLLGALLAWWLVLR